jgi:hypothetical protein
MRQTHVSIFDQQPRHIIDVDDYPAVRKLTPEEATRYAYTRSVDLLPCESTIWGPCPEAREAYERSTRERLAFLTHSEEKPLVPRPQPVCTESVKPTTKRTPPPKRSLTPPKAEREEPAPRLAAATTTPTPTPTPQPWQFVKMCNHWLGFCDRRTSCSYAHSLEELLEPFYEEATMSAYERRYNRTVSRKYHSKLYCLIGRIVCKNERCIHYQRHSRARQLISVCRETYHCRLVCKSCNQSTWIPIYEEDRTVSVSVL